MSGSLSGTVEIIFDCVSLCSECFHRAVEGADGECDIVKLLSQPIRVAEQLILMNLIYRSNIAVFVFKRFAVCILK
jgi:hypothetical protein